MPVILSITEDLQKSENSREILEKNGINVLYNAKLNLPSQNIYQQRAQEYFFNQKIPVNMISSAVDKCKELNLNPEKWDEVSEILKNVTTLTTEESLELLEQKYRQNTKIDSVRKNSHYCMEALNTTESIEEITHALKNVKEFYCKEYNEETGARILLFGISGCGKTSFASDLCSIVMNESVIKIDLGNDVANFTLSGSDPTFSRSKQGIICEAMTCKKSSEAVKNPIIHFDELDKIKTKNEYSAENVFLALLEKNTAKRFMDNFIGVNIDASGINYIFTANNLDTIPVPVLNRLKVFNIPDYTYDQLKGKVIDYFYEGWISSNDMDASFLPEVLSDYMKDEILKESNNDPRSIYEAITKLFTRNLSLFRSLSRFRERSSP